MECQNSQLQAYLGEAAERACRIAIDPLATNRAQMVLDLHQSLQAELVDSIMCIIQQHTVSDKFKGEEVTSARLSAQMPGSSAGGSSHRTAQAFSVLRRPHGKARPQAAE